MMRSKTTGWQQVYQFTFIQTMKSKSVRIMTLILCLIVLLSMTISQLISSKNEKDTKSHIKTVYVVDESGLAKADYSVITKMNEQFSKLTFVTSENSIDELTKKLKDAEKNSILLHIISDQGMYGLNFIKSPNSSITDTELNTLSNLVMTCFNKNRVNILGISSEQAALMDAPITTEVYTAAANGNATTDNAADEAKETMSMSHYYFVLGVITIVVMFLAFCGESIASSIITEKSTRVIEYLMISIRPLAIIIGKVLAMLTIALLQFTIIGISLIVSCFIKKLLYPEGELIPSALKSILTPELLSNVTPVNIILTFFIFICGFLFFALLAGLTGATVSKIEELAEGIMVYNGLMVVGAYIGIAVSIMEMTGKSDSLISYIAYLLPISSVFVTPIYLLLGHVTLVWAMISLLVLILSLVLLAMFTAKIYEALILHQGNRLKIKDLISISKEAKEVSI